MDEPEATLSPARQIGFPADTLQSIGIETRTIYRRQAFADNSRLSRREGAVVGGFLENPERYLRHLFSEDE